MFAKLFLTVTIRNIRIRGNAVSEKWTNTALSPLILSLKMYQTLKTIIYIHMLVRTKTTLVCLCVLVKVLFCLKYNHQNVILIEIPLNLLL